jgi:hypothetical protein
MIDRGRVLRIVRMAVMTGIACAVVLMIPAAPGQTGGAIAPVGGGTTTAQAVPWRPFIDPISVHGSWYWLLIPMAFGVSVVYKAVRMQELQRYWLHVFYMTVQIVIAMILLGAASYVVVMKFAPYVATR